MSAHRSGLQFHLTDKRNSGIPSAGHYLGFEPPRRATGGPPRRGHERRCSLHTEVCPSRGWERLCTPPRTETGVCLLKGEGVTKVLANPRRGVASRSASASALPPPAPLPLPLPLPPGRRRSEGRGQIWVSRLERVGGWVRFNPGLSLPASNPREGPRFHRRRRPPVTSAPAAAVAAAAAAAADSQSQTLASLRSRSQQRSRDSNCSRLLRRARGTLPAPDPPLGSQRLPVPAFPAESVVLVPAPTGQPPPPPPSSGQ